MDINQPILDVKIESIKNRSSKSCSSILKNVEFKLYRKNIIAIVGSNGIGKTTLLSSLLLNLDSNYEVRAKVAINNCLITELSKNELLNYRKNFVKVILQDANNCFDPLLRIGFYFTEWKHSKVLTELFDYFLLTAEDDVLQKFPTEISAGMAQRLAIIWGLLSKPTLLILDEPTSALDATITNLLSHHLKYWINEFSSVVLFTTQDLEFALHTATEVFVLTKDGLTKYAENILIKKK